MTIISLLAMHEVTSGTVGLWMAALIATRNMAAHEWGRNSVPCKVKLTITHNIKSLKISKGLSEEVNPKLTIQ